MLSSNYKGILFKTLNLLVYSFISLNLKIISLDGIGVFQIIFMTSVFGFIFTKLYSEYVKQPVYISQINKLYIARGIIYTLALVCWIKCLSYISVNQATAISYVTPIFAALLAVVLLKEKMSKNIIYALIIGFIGMLIIMRPSTSIVYMGLFLALSSAFLWALYDVIVRKQCKTDNWIKQSYLIFMVNIICTMPFVIANWRVLSLYQVTYIMLVGFLFVLNKYCLVNALGKASLVLLSPISFLRLIFTALLAYLFFKEVIDIYVILGAIIVLLATILTTFDNTLKSR